ncbi:MAG TPA: acyl carrier protein [Candidatus Binataceae bacterium]|nr:acyl carrier protein [Candidatus Binataceae bacterium]
MISRTEIEAVLSRYLQELFELPADKIVKSARLGDDLGLDSIDAVDLVVKLREYTGRKISPSEFKSVRTINDLVERIYVQVNDIAHS